jgi:uncharacterized membrane protein YfcA
VSDLTVAAYAALVVFQSKVVRGIAGFGSGFIAVPLLAVTAPVQMVVPVVVWFD